MKNLFDLLPEKIFSEEADNLVNIFLNLALEFKHRFPQGLNRQKAP